MDHLFVVGWERTQHYKRRSPPWIRLYNDLLNDHAFSRLPDVTKAHFLMIQLLASRLSNRIPYDPRWLASQIGATEPVNLAPLYPDFIAPCADASTALARCLSRAEAEAELPPEIPRIGR